MLSKISNFFKFTQNKTNFYTEIIAGFTTFLTMAYILIVNPAILSEAIYLQQPEDLFAELVIATALSAAFATLIMGLLANYPLALAPGMGLNAFFTFSVVQGLGISWQVALTAIFFEGIIFILLTLTNIRRYLVKVIPLCLKQATAAGIGLFIAYIALTNSNIIISSETTTTTLSLLNQPNTIIAILGTLITGGLVSRRVKGALLWGIIGTALLAWLLGISAKPTGILGIPQFPQDLFGQAIIGITQIDVNQIWELITIIFVFFFVDLFDTLGTLTGVGTQAGYIDEKGEFPRINQALMADALGTTFGAILGTSTVTTYIESAAGVSEGGKTGFTAIIVAILFILSIFFIPLISAIPTIATVPALLMVGVLMMSNVKEIHWHDPAEAIPSFLTILVMPLSYSIAEGLAVGLITYPLMKICQGKARETSLLLWILAAIFLLRFILRGLSITE